MAVIRFTSLEKVYDRKPIHVDPPSDRVSDYFGENVFDEVNMQKYLSKDAYRHVKESILKGSSIDRKMADGNTRSPFLCHLSFCQY